MPLPRTYPAIIAYAQETIRARMAEAGRTAPTPADTADLLALISRLLWHVEARDGGFKGLDDVQLQAKCRANRRLSYAAAVEAAWGPGAWPAEFEASVPAAIAAA